MGRKLVTFEGATPAGGGSQVGELVVGDVTLVRGVPQEVDEKVAKIAQSVEHHKVVVESPQAAKPEGDS